MIASDHVYSKIKEEIPMETGEVEEAIQMIHDETIYNLFPELA